MERATTGLLRVVITVWGVMMSLRMYSFINVMVDCLNCVPSVARTDPRSNPSWQLTRPLRSGCNPRVPQAGSLSLGR